MEDYIDRLQAERDGVANRLVELRAVLDHQELTVYERYLILARRDTLGDYLHLLDKSIDLAISKTQAHEIDEKG